MNKIPVYSLDYYNKTVIKSIMEKYGMAEMDLFLFLIERYAERKGRCTGEVLQEWESKGMT